MILRVILILLIPILSIIFSLMSSGIENIITADNKNWDTIPIYYWLIFWALFWFTLYKVKFGTTKRLKISVLRSIIRFRVYYDKLNLVNQGNELNEMQKKAIKTWDLLLKDKDTVFNCCIITNRRMLIKNDVTCVISTAHEANFNYIRIGKNAVYFDVWLPTSNIAEMFKSFDKEHQLKFQQSIDMARQVISQLN